MGLTIGIAVTLALAAYLGVTGVRNRYPAAIGASGLCVIIAFVYALLLFRGML